jgi:hypothetical protein
MPATRGDADRRMRAVVRVTQGTAPFNVRPALRET